MGSHQRLRQPRQAAPAWIADLQQWLGTQEYSPGTSAQALTVAVWLNAWLDTNATDIATVDTAVLERFAASFAPDEAGRSMVTGRMSVLRRFFLDPHSRNPRGPRGEEKDAVAAELDAWGHWQHTQAGISDAVIGNRRHWMHDFVDELCIDDVICWELVDTRRINTYLRDRGQGYAPASCSLLVSAMRCLLRWALTTNRLAEDLNPGVLRARATRVTLPRGLTREQVTALLAAPDATTRIGLRDRAVLVTLVRLGLRAGELAGLRLEDIDWTAARLQVIGKNQRRLTLPIPADVGEALVAWLRLRPPDAEDRAVFVRLRAPIHALSSAGISDIVTHAAAQAGLGVIHSHRLRHTAASNVIAAGGSLAEAQELLGHAHQDSTKVYARSDVDSLRTLAVPFGRLP